MRLLLVVACLAASATALEIVTPAKTAEIPSSTTATSTPEAHTSASNPPAHQSKFINTPSDEVPTETVKVEQAPVISKVKTDTSKDQVPRQAEITKVTEELDTAEPPAEVTTSDNDADDTSSPVTTLTETVQVVNSSVATPADEIKTSEDTYTAKNSESQKETKHTVKVVDLPSTPETVPVRMQIPTFTMPDIGPMIVPPEVMRQVDNMANTNGGAAHPFGFYSPEPLYHIQVRDVEKNPTNQLSAQMDPVVIVETGANEHTDPFNNAPERMKVIDSPEDFHNIQMQIEQIIPVPIGYRSLPPEIKPDIKQPQFQNVPKEFLRNQFADVPDEFRPIPPEFRRHIVSQYFPEEFLRDQEGVPETFRPLPIGAVRHLALQHSLEIPNDFVQDRPADAPEGFRPIPSGLLRRPQSFSHFYGEPSANLVEEEEVVAYSTRDFSPFPPEYYSNTIPSQFVGIPRKWRRHPPQPKVLNPAYEPYPFWMYHNPMMR